VSKAKSPARSNPETKRLAKFERSLGCRFADRALLEEALTHPSYVHEHPEEEARDYERLEFIGDAVLELATSHILFELRSGVGEGELTFARADLVNKGRLALLAEEMGVGEVLRLGSGERKGGGARKPSILASALEAVLGAVYLDRGWKRAFKLIEQLLSAVVASQPVDLRDPRGILQEWAQAQSGTMPEYRYLPPAGPPHKKIFRVEVVVDNGTVSTGEGASKKDACREAALAALKKIMPKRYNQLTTGFRGEGAKDLSEYNNRREK